jgi:hypothetical protein
MIFSPYLMISYDIVILYYILFIENPNIYPELCTLGFLDPKS